MTEQDRDPLTEFVILTDLVEHIEEVMPATLQRALADQATKCRVAFLKLASERDAWRSELKHARETTTWWANKCGDEARQRHRLQALYDVLRDPARKREGKS